MIPLQPARLEFAPDGTPFATVDGKARPVAPDGPPQAGHVFLAGNGLPERWRGRDRFVILATGFGAGLAFLAAWRAWRDDPQRCRRLHFVSVEAHPFTAADLALAQHAWPEFAELAGELQRAWPPLTPGMHRIFLAGGAVILTLVFGEATTALRAVDASVDAFFLDGFPPEPPPQACSPELCRALSRLAAPGATLAAESLDAAGCDALAAAEFDLETRPGLAGRGTMLAGRFRSRRPDRHRPPAERRAVVIGAGVAGCTAAAALARAGWQVEVVERAATPATGASCNLAGVLRPLPSADDNRLSRLTRAGYLATRALLQSLPDARWSPCGVLHLGREPVHEATQRRVVDRLQLPPEVLQFVEPDAASRLLGRPVDIGGWWFPGGGWVNPASVCRAALASDPARIVARFNVAVDRLERTETGWRLLDADGGEIATAPVVVMASGAAAPGFAQFAWLPQKSARGQVSHLPADASPALPLVVCRHGYAMPEIDGRRLIGATLQSGDPDPAPRVDDHRENLARLRLSLPGYVPDVDPATLEGRVGFRPMSPDRLPIVGPVPDPAAAPANARLPALPRQPGLWCVQGFGARGIVWSALMADLLVSRLEGDPLPLETDLVDAIDPGRFLLKSRGRPQDDDGFDDRT